MLKNSYLFLLLLLLPGNEVFSQASSGAIGVHLSAIDFYGPQTGNYFFQKSKNGKSLFWDPAFHVSYQKVFSKHIDFKAAANLSSLMMPATQNDTTYILVKQQTLSKNQQLGFASLHAGIVFSFLPKNEFIITPQADAGIGYYFHKSNNGVSSHAGLGLNIHLTKNLNLLLNSNYHYSLTNRYQSFLQHSLGVLYNFGKEIGSDTTAKPKVRKVKKEKQVKEAKQDMAIPVELPVQDTDNDGIPDGDDNCITEPGRRETFGCPDRDKDGVADKQDMCPDVKGNRTARGCPDADSDGIEDEKDTCPEMFGKTANGCPLPEEVQSQPIESDTTSKLNEELPAAVNQEVLKAASEKVKVASKQILFNSGTAYIHPSSYFALDTIINVLKLDTNLHVDIEGHTDNVGNEKENLALSQQRADACKEYLTRHGIAENRISAIGYGDMNPLTSNETAAGRMINRRTEFLLFIPER